MPGESGKKKRNSTSLGVSGTTEGTRDATRESEMVKGTRRVPEVNLMALNFGTPRERERERKRESEARFVVKV